MIEGERDRVKSGRWKLGVRRSAEPAEGMGHSEASRRIAGWSPAHRLAVSSREWQGVIASTYSTYMAIPTPSGYDVPDEVSRSGLWKRVSKKTEYAHAIAGIRKVASTLGAKIADAMPEYTDHSVEHMDSLWRISGQVLSEVELDMFSDSEAFVLGAAFYLHDLGMASTVTAAGKEEIRATEQYKIAFARFRRMNPADQGRVDSLALREATRELHANKAMDLAASPIPGLDRFLIEDSEFRRRGHSPSDKSLRAIIGLWMKLNDLLGPLESPLDPAEKT